MMITIRIATVEDAESIQKIYAPYVLNTTITFELEPPTVKEMADRIRHTLEKYPYLVAVEEGEVIGYAYAGTLYDRRAYDHSAELSIYIDDRKRHKGTGHLLYNALIDYLTRMNTTNLYGCITYPNDASIAFHEKYGFKEAAHFHECGYKFDQWLDVVYLEKRLDKTTEPFIPFKELC